nr:hypothetical protein [Tanacetum cinerariifolium]
MVKVILVRESTNQNNENGNESGNGSHDLERRNKRTVHTARGCMYKEFLNYQPLNLRALRVGNYEARRRVYALGGGNANQDPNVITCMFLLNNRYTSILFNTGADWSFVSTAFSSLIDIAQSALDTKYDVELADGKIIRKKWNLKVHNTTTKLPLLKQGNYEMWRLQIEQYFQIQDYALWDVIKNSNSFKPVAETTTDDVGTSTTIILGHVTIKENAKKKNDVKARSMLLMALPNEHLMTFNQCKDAKTLFVAIETRFGGNEATKKTQKTLLKQLYKNFSATSTESLDLIFNRFQKLRNKSDLDTMSLDDLYNNFKIVEQEVSGTISTNTSSQNMDFVSSPSLNNTSEVPTVFGVSIVSPQVNNANLSDVIIYAFLANQPNRSQLMHEDLDQIHEDDLEEMDLKWQLALLSMRAKIFFQKTGKKITINGSDITSYDKSKVECFICHKMGHFARECRSYMADDETPTNMAFMALSDSETFSVKISAPVKENIGAPIIEDCESNEEDEVESSLGKERKNVEPSVNKLEVEIPKKNDKPTRRPVKYAEMYRTQRPRVPKAMLTRTGLKPVNLVRPVNPKRNFFKKINNAKEKVNTTRPNSIVLNAVRENKGKVVKASACWVWRPIKLDSASIVLKKHTYIDARGRSKFVMAWIPKEN